MAAMASPWVESTLLSLRGEGFRNGGARRAVVDLLGRQNCCLTAQEMFDRLRDEGNPVGIASIYRVLELLSEKGFVQRIEVGSGVARYEPAHHEGEHHHHHLVCDRCGKVEAFADEELEAAIHNVEGRTGYRVAGHDVVLRGACADCR